MSDLIKEIIANQYYPPGICRVVLDELVDNTDGAIEVVDTINPVVFTLKSAAAMVSATMESIRANTRRQYPMVAQTWGELYCHMADKDYLSRFAIPSKATIKLAISKEELDNRLVLDSDTGHYRITIPRNTYFTVGGNKYSINYPIDIIRLRHGGYTVLYDATVVSPLQELSTNRLEWQFISIASVDFILIDIDVFQFGIVTHYDSVTSAIAFKATISLTDQFYYARVYYKNSSSEWVEMKTTHSEEVYDILTPTATLQYAANSLEITIPQIYISQGMVSGNLRIDVYESKGNITQDLGSYPAEGFAATWLALDASDSTIFTAPLPNIRTTKIFSDSIGYGGRNQITFVEQRQRVMDNAVAAQVIPITPAQAQGALSDSGYEIVKNIDNLTDRVFIATKQLPDPSNKKLINAAGMGMGVIFSTLDNALLQDTIVENGDTITIGPDTLYEKVNGVISFVSDAKKQYLLSLPPDKLALAVTSADIYYSPFHYVLDITNDEFSVRPYYMEAPAAVSKTFVGVNDTTLVQVTMDGYSFVRTENGYALHIVTTSDATYKDLLDSEVFAQLSYIPVGEKSRAYIQGKLLGTDPATLERIWQFDFPTNMKITEEHNLELSGFKMYTQDTVTVETPLLQEFDVVLGTSAVMGTQWVGNTVDNLLGRLYLPSRAFALVHEKITVRFGWSLSTLWAKSRSVPSTYEYEAYPEDVHAKWPEDVYEIDPVTKSPITLNPDGTYSYNLIHKKGDVILDGEGVPTIKHKKGDLIISEFTGRPIIANPRQVLRQFSILLVEGEYWFSTNQISVDYRKEIATTLVSWLTTDIADIQSRTLDMTRVYFYPKSTLGDIEVMVGAGRVVKLNAGQSIVVTLTVDRKTYNNYDLREKLESITVKTIGKWLKEAIVTTSDAIDALRTEYGTDVIGIELTGLGGTENYGTVTVLDQASRCGIAKRLVAQDDNTLIVEDNLTINFVRHEI